MRARSKVATRDLHSSHPTIPSSPPSHCSMSSFSFSRASLISGNFFLPPARFLTTSLPSTYDMRVCKYDFHSLKEVGKLTSAASYEYVRRCNDLRAVGDARGPSKAATSGARSECPSALRRAYDASLVFWIAVHQCRKENGLRKRSSSRTMSFVETSSELCVGIGTGYVRGKCDVRDSSEGGFVVGTGITSRRGRTLVGEEGRALIASLSASVAANAAVEISHGAGCASSRLSDSRASGQYPGVHHPRHDFRFAHRTPNMVCIICICMTQRSRYRSMVSNGFATPKRLWRPRNRRSKRSSRITSFSMRMCSQRHVK